MSDWVEVYQRADGDWGWRRQSPNGRIRSTSGEGYRNQGDCVVAATDLNPGCEVRVGDGDGEAQPHQG